jgi:hypothetical protein
MISYKPILLIMSTYTAVRQSLYRPRAVGALCKANGLKRLVCVARQRLFATAAVDDSALPLNGYRVLDMTRVLAGVSGRVRICKLVIDKSGAAILYSNTWRSRV